MVLGFLFFFYVVNCIVLILFVLIQQSKGGGLAGAFGGGGGSDTFFGYTSMQKIGHWTIYSAVGFIVLALLISNIPVKQSEGLMEFQEGGIPATAPVTAPVAPVGSGNESADVKDANSLPAEGQEPPAPPQ